MADMRLTYSSYSGTLPRHSQRIVSMSEDINHNSGGARKRQPGKALDGLTGKQRAYVTARAGGASRRAAYVTAYDTRDEASPGGQNANAVRVERAPAVAAALARAERVLEAGQVWTGAKLRAFVLSGLITEATSCPAPSARVRALELLGKHAGLWSGGDDPEALTVDAAGLRRRIERKVREMLGNDVPGPGTSPHDAAPAPARAVEEGTVPEPERQGEAPPPEGGDPLTRA